MADGAAARIPLPEIPKLDPEDVKAIRASLPGKLLGRLAALLALCVLVLSFAGAVDQGLKQFLGVNLAELPRLRFTLLFGLPALVVIAQLGVEWRARRAADRLRQLAVTPAEVPAGYFRIGPYRNTEEDRAAFRRADRAHEKVLAWLREREGAPLYLTGQSGCGKSSVLQAFVIPTLQRSGWAIAEARAWQDPIAALRESLLELPGAPRGAKARDAGLRELIEAVARRAAEGLLVVLDQFEEFVILQDDARRSAFAALLNDLNRQHVPGLRLLLAFRSDYRPALGELELPPMREGENWEEVGAFTTKDAAAFLTRGQLGLQPEAMDKLLESAARLDDLAGLLRPITLNVVGHVLAAGRAQAATLNAEALVRSYVAGQSGSRSWLTWRRACWTSW
jgi:hypothetical protein